MTGWLSFEALGSALARVAAVWLSFWGAGSLAIRVDPVRRHLGATPKPVLGIMVTAALVALLSLLGLLHWWLCAVLVFVGAVAGVLELVAWCRSARPTIPSPPWLQLPLLILVVAAAVTNLLYAGWLNVFMNDPIVTYAVQPARWLSSGGMHFLSETPLSGRPLLAEMVFVWPTALAVDRLDQLLLLQVFNMVALSLIVPMSHRRAGAPRTTLLPAMLAVLTCNMLLSWTRVAKPDALAVMFATLSLAIESSAALGDRKPVGGYQDISSGLLMGMAISAKLTASLALIPYVLLLVQAGRRVTRHSRRYVLERLLAAAVLPSIFAVRTMVHTGSPFYPNLRLPWLLRETWRIPSIEAIRTSLDSVKSYYSLTMGNPRLLGIAHMLATWEAPAVLLAAGGLTALIRRRAGEYGYLLGGIALYAVASTFVFWPTWWGGKYTIIIIPFLAVAGGRMIGASRLSVRYSSIAAVLLILFFYSTDPYFPVFSISPSARAKFIQSFAAEEWKLPSRSFNVPQALGIHMWANSHLPDGTVLVALQEWDRHFSDHPVIVATRHPVGMRLYLDNSVEDERDILGALGADYVYYTVRRPVDPCLMDSLALLRHVGRGRLLEPVEMINGVQLCRVNPDYLRE